MSKDRKLFKQKKPKKNNHSLDFSTQANNSQHDRLKNV